MPSFNFNAIYAPVFTSNKRYIDIMGGRGRGGSHFGTEYFLFLITQKQYFRGYFIRQVFSDIRDSLFRDFKDRMNENESLNTKDFHIQDNEMRITYIPTGNTILSKGVSKDGSRTAKMKSLAGATHVLIEESDELKEDDFDQLDLSLRTVKAAKVEIVRIFNPPTKQHWIWRDYNLVEVKETVNGKEEVFFKAEAKSTSPVLAIFSTYLDNLANLQQSTIDKLESFRETKPEYYFNQVKGFISEGAKGRIYSGWKIIADADYNDIDLPKIYAIDFGYSQDPTVVLEVKYHKNYRYFKELLYESGLDNIALGKRLRDLGLTISHIIVADPGSGGDLRIAELRRGWQGLTDYPDLRFNIRSTIKGQGSINFGISKVKECVNHMTEDSVNGWKEYQEYKWALDADKNPSDNPVDKFNHLMDCRRYFELCKGRFY